VERGEGLEEGRWPSQNPTLHPRTNMSRFGFESGRKDRAMEKINLAQKFSLFHDHWSPKIVGELNDSQVKLVKVQGEFVWHHHEVEDELFLVLKGRLTIKLRDRDIALDEGEFVIIPRGVEHKPVAEQEVHLLLLEPKSTLNTGNVENERTTLAQWI
jgi:mannose-6-phosphate isomerase-like protein (cupin superfamily)